MLQDLNHYFAVKGFDTDVQTWGTQALQSQTTTTWNMVILKLILISGKGSRLESWHHTTEDIQVLLLSSPTSSSSSPSDMSLLSSFPLRSWLSRSCFLFKRKKLINIVEHTMFYYGSRVNHHLQVQIGSKYLQ